MMTAGTAAIGQQSATGSIFWRADYQMSRPITRSVTSRLTDGVPSVTLSGPSRDFSEKFRNRFGGDPLWPIPQPEIVAAAIIGPSPQESQEALQAKPDPQPS